MTSRLTNLVPVLAGLILGGTVCGTASAQVGRFDVDFADEDAAYFATPVQEPKALSRPVLTTAAARDVSSAFTAAGSVADGPTTRPLTQSAAWVGRPDLCERVVAVTAARHPAIATVKAAV